MTNKSSERTEQNKSSICKTIEKYTLSKSKLHGKRSRRMKITEGSLSGNEVIVLVSSGKHAYFNEN